MGPSAVRLFAARAHRSPAGCTSFFAPRPPEPARRAFAELTVTTVAGLPPSSSKARGGGGAKKIPHKSPGSKQGGRRGGAKGGAGWKDGVGRMARFNGPVFCSRAPRPSMLLRRAAPRCAELCAPPESSVPIATTRARRMRNVRRPTGLAVDVAGRVLVARGRRARNRRAMWGEGFGESRLPGHVVAAADRRCRLSPCSPLLTEPWPRTPPQPHHPIRAGGHGEPLHTGVAARQRAICTGWRRGRRRRRQHVACGDAGLSSLRHRVAPVCDQSRTEGRALTSRPFPPAAFATASRRPPLAPPLRARCQAGTGKAGCVDGYADVASFNLPSGLRCRCFRRRH